jgi:hypothetical protein
MADQIPVIEAEKYMKKTEGWEEECTKVAQSFHKYGIVKFRDPRVVEKDNNVFIDMVEKYFEETGKKYYNGEKIADIRPELCYQTGATPEGQERARDHQKLVDTLVGDNKPRSIQPPVIDAKWRFFWKIGDRPEEIKDEIP